MRIILLFILSAVFALSALGQNSEQIQKDKDGNVIALFGKQDSVNHELIQEGVENLFFIYSMQDSSASNIQADQSGYSNKILSIISGGKGSFLQRFDQKGERNKVHVLQKSTQDSTIKEINKIDIKQKGSENSVTIIQQ